MSIIIKENIDNIKDLPNISECDEIHINNIIKSITNIISKKKLIIQLLNKNLTKLTIDHDEINKEITIPFIRSIYKKYNNNYTGTISHNNFRCYPENINFLHLIIYHNIDIDKLLLFLLYRFYRIYKKNIYLYYSDDIQGSISGYIGKLYYLYNDVINSANKFDKYNFNFGQDYETLFLGDYENLKEDDMNILIEKNKELEKRIDIIIEQNNIQYNDTKNDMNILIEKNKELEKRIDIIIEQNNIIEKNKELEKRIDIIIEQNNNEIDKLNKSINKLSNVKN